MATIASIIAATSTTISTMTAAAAIASTNLLVNQLLCTLNCLSTALYHNALLASTFGCCLVNLAVGARLTANVANGLTTLAHHKTHLVTWHSHGVSDVITTITISSTSPTWPSTSSSSTATTSTSSEPT